MKWQKETPSDYSGGVSLYSARTEPAHTGDLCAPSRHCNESRRGHLSRPSARSFDGPGLTFLRSWERAFTYYLIGVVKHHLHLFEMVNPRLTSIIHL